MRVCKRLLAFGTCHSSHRRLATGKIISHTSNITILTEWSCHTRRGEVLWTDELDDYASECAEWAKTGEPWTVYPAASRFASFCNNFSDACEATTTVSEPESTTAIVETATETETESETDKPTGSETEPTGTQGIAQPGSTDAGVELRVGCVAGLVVALAFAAHW